MGTKLSFGLKTPGQSVSGPPTGSPSYSQAATAKYKGKAPRPPLGRAGGGARQGWSSNGPKRRSMGGSWRSP